MEERLVWRGDVTELSKLAVVLAQLVLLQSTQLSSRLDSESSSEAVDPTCSSTKQASCLFQEV